MMNASGYWAKDLSERSNKELFAAERELKKKLGKDPGNAAYYLELSTIYAALFDRTRKKMGQHAEEWLWRSGDALEKTLMMDPKNKIALYNLGVVYKRQGRMEKAREELKKALGLCDPGQDAYMMFACWMQIGMIYEEKGFLDEAREAYLKAREYDYGNQDAQEAIREINIKRKDPDARGGAGDYGLSPSGMGRTMVPSAGAQQVMGMDPNLQANQPQALAQALPYLGQMLAQKFGGGDQGDN